MKDTGFNRMDSLFSLCGLNCSLCPGFVRGSCCGCSADSPCALTCTIAPCSVEHGNVEYCFLCEQYPCEKYEGFDQRDLSSIHEAFYRRCAVAKLKVRDANPVPQNKERGIFSSANLCLD